MKTPSRTCLRRLPRFFLLLCLLALVVTTRHALAWSEPHGAITKAALDVLAPWQKELLRDELGPLADYYCTIPDLVQNPALLKDVGDAKFARMSSEPGKVYLLKLHLPAAEQPENLETLRYFMDQAVSALRAGKVGDAARYMGTICHLLEDFGSPAHTIPGDNMFTLFQQFLPPPEAMKGKLLHGPIESGALAVAIAGYQPKLLGATVEEASWRLLHRTHEVIINARGTTIPIIQALYAGDSAAVVAGQMKAATVDAQVLADALHTILCLGAEKFDAGQQDQLRSVGVAAFWPLEAVNLYFPQSHFFSSPYWGHARTGIALEGGTKPVPLKLRTAGKDSALEKVFTQGISTGMGRPLTFLLPKGVYPRLTVLAGLQSGLGEKGRVEFTILGDGKPLATATVSGTDPAHAFDVDLTGVTQVQFAVISRGTEPKSNYAIWAEPVLWK
jgi:hypothetical protein